MGLHFPSFPLGRLRTNPKSLVTEALTLTVGETSGWF